MNVSTESLPLQEPSQSSWSGIWAMTLVVSGLMMAEFLPAGVLTPMAADLNITEGMAGQSVTATSVFAVISSLTIAFATRQINRRSVLLFLSACLTLSSLIVAFTPNMFFLMTGRVLMGIALGGFWSIAAAIAIRIVTTKDVPKALSIIFGSASLSAALAAPLGSYLGDIIGWRYVFVLASLVGLVGFVWQYISLPSLHPEGEVKLSTTFKVLKVPSFSMGLIAVGLAFCGRFASITYMRPFLEQETGLHGNAVSAVFLAFDAAYFVGTLMVSRLISSNLRKTMTIPPLVLALCSIVLYFYGDIVPVTVAAIFVLGGAFAPIPISWSTWTTKTVPDNRETAGGLQVAAIQLSAGIGAIGGGVIVDSVGTPAMFALCGLSWVLSTLFIIMFIPENNIKISEPRLERGAL